MFIGVVGKPNAGKSTFFSGATLIDTKIAPFPFTTIEANRGKAYLRGKCPCRELNVTCRPKNSLCVNGVRLIPIEIVDVAGLVPNAHNGKGLGLKFLDDLRGADALIQVVDVSGKTDLEGNPAEDFDPVEEVRFLVKEIEYWIAGIIKRGMGKVRGRGVEELAELLSGLKVTRSHIDASAGRIGLGVERIDWSDEEILNFSVEVRAASKPIAIAANKVDAKNGRANFEKLVKTFPDMIIVPTCAEAELALRRAGEKGLVEYVPGDTKFEIVGGSQRQQDALKAAHDDFG
ncbi:MAG: GTPase [Candidatus Micrarchaeota archaeon]